jgi:hypothetical protein
MMDCGQLVRVFLFGDIVPQIFLVVWLLLFDRVRNTLPAARNE